MTMLNKLPIFVAVLLIVTTAGGVREHFTTEQGLAVSSESLQFWVKVIPEDGWKFNAEYPTKVNVKTSGYDLVETAVSKEEESTAHVIRATVKRNGDNPEVPAKMQAKFSVCNDTSCLVYKREFSFCQGDTCKE
jgi:ABC-type glycerol-3-phosphate transport system substrate-binding protein